jgi:hypothetical protein
MEVRGQLHAPAALPRETDRDTHCIRAWVGPRAGLDVMEERKISCPYRDSNPDLSVIISTRVRAKGLKVYGGNPNKCFSIKHM